MGDQAAVDRHHLVRAVLEQPRPAGGVDRVADPGPPAQRSTGQRLDRDPQRVDLGIGEPTQAGELLADHGPLPVELGGRGHVLEVAAAATDPAGRTGRAG